MGRSKEFERYLDRLSPAQREAILKAEADFLNDWSARRATHERVHEEQMLGHSVTPAGTGGNEESED